MISDSSFVTVKQTSVIRCKAGQDFNSAKHVKQAGVLVTKCTVRLIGGRSADGNSENCRSKIIVCGGGFNLKKQKKCSHKNLCWAIKSYAVWETAVFLKWESPTTLMRA